MKKAVKEEWVELTDGKRKIIMLRPKHIRTVVETLWDRNLQVTGPFWTARII